MNFKILIKASIIINHVGSLECVLLFGLLKW